MDPAPAHDVDGGEGASRVRRLARLALRGLGWLIVIVATVGTALGVLVEFACQARLAERRKEWAVEAAAVRSLVSAPRPVLGSATSGNAAHDYAALEWVLDPRSTWPLTPPAGMAPPALPRGFAANMNVDLIRRASAEIERGAPLPAEAAAVVSKLAPTVRHLTDGLGRPVCDWGLTIDAGTTFALPNLLALRLAAQLHLAVAGQTPDGHARAALDVVRFGQDVARLPTLLASMFGVSIEQLGLRALEAALARGVSADVLRDVVRGLLLRPAPFAAALASERLRNEAWLASHDPAAFAELNRATYAGFFERYTAIALAPYTDRGRLDPNLDAEVAATWVTFARAMPNVRVAAFRVDEVEVSRGAVRLLAAAHLFRLERGAWPPDLAALAPFAGGPPPADPFQGPGATLSIAVVGSELRAYSCGSDGVDDGGATGPKRELAPDYTFTTR